MRVEARRGVDAAWDRLWSEGISNPLRAVEVISLALLGLRLKDESSETRWNQWEPESVALRVQDQLQIDFAEAARQVPVAAFRAVLGDLVSSGLHEHVDSAGDALEYALSHLSTAGRFGQFRTPSHIAEFMARCLPIHESAVVLDPAAGTGGFLIAALSQHANLKLTALGDEIDPVMASLANANLALHSSPGAIRRGDALISGQEEADFVLANPPFAGRVSDRCDLATEVASNKTEVLFVDLITKRLRPGGWAAMVLPISVLTNTDKGTTAMRRLLHREGAVRAIVELPSGVFRPYTDVRTAIVFWQKNGVSNCTYMWQVQNDGFTLDDRRRPIESNDLSELADELVAALADLPGEFTGVSVPSSQLSSGSESLLPARYLKKEVPESSRPDVVDLLKRALEQADAIRNELGALL